MLIDVFFKLAVPLTIFTLLVAVAVLRYNRRRPVYSGADGARRRDAINERYKTNRGGIVIGLIVAAFYVLTVYGLFDHVGPRGYVFATVVGVLLLIPFATVAGALVLLYTLVVHFIANRKGGAPPGDA